MIVVDFDDFGAHNHKLNRLHELKQINPLFKCTVFAVPTWGTDDFWASIPRWIELAVHGWRHPDPRECENWPRDQIEAVLDTPVVRKHFVNGWKSPGWQTSDAIYEVLQERGWWVADQHLEDARRPEGLRTYLYEDHNSFHGHIQDWGSNGIDESWWEIVAKITGEDEFRFCSEVAQ